MLNTVCQPMAAGGLFSCTRQPSERKRKDTSASREILNKSNTNYYYAFESQIAINSFTCYCCQLLQNLLFKHQSMAKLRFGFHEANFLLLMCAITNQSAPLLPTVHSYIQT